MEATSLSVLAGAILMIEEKNLGDVHDKLVK